MRNVLALLHCLSTVFMVLVHTCLEIDAATRSVFKPVVPEDQTVSWLKKHNHDAEELGKGRYRIYWRDYSGGDLRDEDGDPYSIRTFDWGPRGGKANVLVASRVELVKTGNRTTPDTGLPEYRYTYNITSLETSQQPVRSLKIRTHDLPKNWKRDISNPPGWKNYGQPLPHAGSNNGVSWSPKSGTPYISPGTSQGGFVFECRNLPGTIRADVWTSGGSIKGHEAVTTPYHHEYAPRGLVVGPVAIPVETSVLELTRRLESLTSHSIELRWLDASTAALLQQHLTDTIIAFGKNQQSQARREIQAFITTLDALEKQRAASDQTDKMTSPSAGAEKQNSAEPPIIEEAFTLLKTNAEYLLTQL